MAFVRLLSLPSISQFSTHQYPSCSQTTPLSSLPKDPQFHNTFCPPISYLSHSTSPFTKSPLSQTLPIKTQNSNRFLFSAAIELTEVESQPAEEDEDEASGTRVLAQNVPWTSTADELRPIFERYGTVVGIELSMHNKTRNRGLAFITMGSPEEARAAINNLESYEFEGRTLKLNWAKPQKEKPPVVQSKPVPIHNLFVANLPFEARAKDLKEFFNSGNANVVSAEIVFHEKPRRSAGYGFVSFNYNEEAEAALSAFQGKVFMGRSIRVAHSKTFLRQEAKMSIQSENTSTNSTDSNQQ